MGIYLGYSPKGTQLFPLIDAFPVCSMFFFSIIAILVCWRVIHITTHCFPTAKNPHCHNLLPSGTRDITWNHREGELDVEMSDSPKGLGEGFYPPEI